MLPIAASKQLPTRSRVIVDGTLEWQSFQATLEPNGEGSHWFKVDNTVRGKVAAAPGDNVAFEITPVEKEPEPKVPADLKQALAGNPAAKATRGDITRDWIYWITSGVKAETRAKRHRRGLRQARQRHSPCLLIRPFGHVQQRQHGSA